MEADFRLETERLRLRRYRPGDLDDLHAMFSDPEHMR
jgi:RimJ/RimL family protein N-acetyltransferase